MAFTPAAHPPQPADVVPEAPFRLLVERAPDAILLVRDERILYANPAAAALLGAPSAAGLADGPAFALLAPGQREQAAARCQHLARHGAGPIRFEAQLHRPDGALIEIEIAAARVECADGPAAMLAVRDATERKLAERAMERLAFFDPLTRLPNRAALEGELFARLAAAARDGSLVGVLMLDLDGFKAVNDRHGHRVGDLVLTAVAERLLQAVRRSDLVARLHGDEFVIATGDHLTTEAVAGVAERVLEALRSPVAVDGRQLGIRASIGVAVFPLDAAPAAELLARADAALYAAKARGGDAWERDTRLDPGAAPTHG